MVSDSLREAAREFSSQLSHITQIIQTIDSVNEAMTVLSLPFYI